MPVPQHRPPRPHRIGHAVTKARGASFAEASKSAGVPVENVGATDVAPFTGANALAEKRKYAAYSVSAQGCIQRALDEQAIATHVDRATGTAPELVVLGFALNQTLFFQTATYRDPIFNPAGRAFPVDILVVEAGVMWYMPVDGAHYHMATIEEQVRDQRRNGNLSRYGQVLPISDIYCHTEEDLKSFLDAHGAP
jgi:hypothetical protein